MDHTPANSNVIDLVDSPPPQKSCIPVLQLSQRFKHAQADAANSRGKPKIINGNYENEVKHCNPSANNKRKYVDESETPFEKSDDTGMMRYTCNLQTTPSRTENCAPKDRCGI